MPHYRIIANPVSARGSGAHKISAITRRLDQIHLDYELVLTTHPWHAAELARQAALDGIEVVVAAGGDGTSNEVINGLLGLRPSGMRLPILAVLPIGRGNDFAFSMGAPIDIEQSILALRQMKTRPIDIGFLVGGNFPGGRYFGNGVGIGFDTLAGLEAERLPYITGFITYLMAAIRTIFIMKAPSVEIKLDDQEWVQAVMLVSIMNGKRLGGGFWTAPHSRYDDELFDLCVAADVTKPQMFALIPRFLKGTQARHPAIQMARSHKVRVTARKGALAAHADGELISRACQQLELEILPRQLQMVVGEDGTSR